MTSVADKKDKTDGTPVSATQELIPVHVYCRIRPTEYAETLNWLRVQSAKTIEVQLPQNMMQPRGGGLRQYEYGFKEVFNVNSQQADVYKTVARPLVKNLLAGRNSLLFTYGMTGSGKTYTMTGSDPELGIMQRCLGEVFADIGNTQMAKYCYRPDGLNGFELLEAVKTKPIDAKLSQQKTAASKGGCQKYAVFVSYIEFYNNSIYDLLTETTTCQRQMRSHIIREDVQRNQMYAHGVAEVEVKNVVDALTVFQLGQKRKHMAETLLNAESSRSHSSFNIRVVRLQCLDKPKLLISQLSLVDLAGSERTSRTHNSGLRLREASQVNNSLLTLRTCLDYLRDNQRAAAGAQLKKIPYRDSKLTHMFKPYFEGEGQVSMIVCIRPHVRDCSETLHVLKFAELTRELQIARVVPSKKTPVPPATQKLQPQAPQVTSEVDNVLEQTYYTLGPEFSAVHVNDGDMALTNKQYTKILSQRVQRRLTLRRQLYQKFEYARLQIEQLQFENQKLHNELSKAADAMSQAEQQRVKLTKKLKTVEQWNANLSQKLLQRQLQVKALQEQVNSKHELMLKKAESEAACQGANAVEQHKQTYELHERLRKQANVLSGKICKKYKKLCLVSRILRKEVTATTIRRAMIADQLQAMQSPMEVDGNMKEAARPSRGPNYVDVSVQAMPTADADSYRN